MTTPHTPPRPQPPPLSAAVVRARTQHLLTLEKWCIFGFCGVQEKPPGVMWRHSAVRISPGALVGALWSLACVRSTG